MSDEVKKFEWPELWLTPLIGLACLAPYIHHHGFQLVGSVWVAILAGGVPLIATAVVQWLLKYLKGLWWLQTGAAILIGGVLVGMFYYYALYPADWSGDPAGWATDAEGHGNDVALYNYQSQNFAIIGAFAAGVSAAVTGVYDRVRAFMANRARVV